MGADGDEIDPALYIIVPAQAAALIVADWVAGEGGGGYWRIQSGSIWQSRECLQFPVRA